MTDLPEFITLRGKRAELEPDVSEYDVFGTDLGRCTVVHNWKSGTEGRWHAFSDRQDYGLFEELSEAVDAVNNA